jgi:hypothetical protein
MCKRCHISVGTEHYGDMLVCKQCLIELMPHLGLDKKKKKEKKK